MSIKLLRKNFLCRVVCIFLIAATLLSFSSLLSTPVSAAATAKASKKVDATPAYTLSLNFNYKIHNFHIGYNYIYVAQNSGSTTYISRLKINGKTASYQDHMTLKQFGLGETLDMYNYNGKTYFLVGCKDDVTAKVDSPTGFYASHQIARIEYSPGTTISEYTKVARFTTLDKAASSASKATDDGDLKRVNAAVCDDVTIFRIENTDNEERYIIYRTEDLNAALDKTGTSGMAMNSAAAIASKSKNMTIQSGDTKVHPNSSFKGMDICNYLTIYLAGGGSGDANPQIAMMDNTGTYDMCVTIGNISKTEMNGLHVNAGNLYFSTTPTSNYKTGQEIYYISENVFTKSCRTSNEVYGNHEIRYTEGSWTCTSNGWTPYCYCIYCGRQQSTQEYYSERGHRSISLPAVNATCTTYGKLAGSYCQLCNVPLTAQSTIAPLGHSYAGVLTQAPTCTLKGITTYTCANCGDKYTEESEKLLHKDSDNDSLCDVCGGSTDAEPQSILLDYAKTVESNIIEKAIVNGISEEFTLNAELLNVTHAEAENEGFGDAEIFDGDGDGKAESIRFTPKDILSKIIRLNCTIKLTDLDGTTQTRIIPVNIVPATSVYYETDFADGVFELTTTESEWSKEGSASQGNQDNGDYDIPVSEFTFDSQNIPANAFFADFNGETERYRDYIYGGKNYDEEGSWGANTKRTTAPDINSVAGTMTITQLITTEGETGI